MDDDRTAVVNLIKLYNIWLQNSIFNCRNSGFGPDPADGTDAEGAVCVQGPKPKPNGNKKWSLKCRIQYQFKRMFNAYAGDNTLTFS